MKNLFSIFLHEGKAYFKAGFSSFVFVMIIAISWAVSFSLQYLDVDNIEFVAYPIFLAMALSTDITTTTFVRDRLSGNLEILLVSGISIMELIISKTLLVLTVTLLLGTVSFVLADILSYLLGVGLYQNGKLFVSLFSIYISTVLLLSSTTAYLTLNLKNPRVSSIVNIIILSVIVFIYSIGNSISDISIFVLSLFEIIMSFTIFIITIKTFKVEKVIGTLTY